MQTTEETLNYHNLRKKYMFTYMTTTELLKAAKTGDVETLRALIAAEADYNYVDDFEWTA